MARGNSQVLSYADWRCIDAKSSGAVPPLASEREDHSSKGHARGPRRAAHVNAGNHWSTGEHRHDWKIAGQGGVGNGYGSGIGRRLPNDSLPKCQSCRSRHLSNQIAVAEKLGRIASCSGRRVKSADVQAMLAAAVSKFGGLHVLCNNAAIEGHMARSANIRRRMDKVIAINLRSVFLACATEFR